MATTEQSTNTEPMNFKGMSIYEKMMYVRQNIGPIRKTLNVVSEDNSDRYKGVAAADIINPIEKLFEEVGIFKVPGEIDYQINGRLTTQKQSYRFVNVHSPSEEIVAYASGQGFDMADKGINAASTNAIKYLYMRMFGLMAENEDPEAVHSMDKVYSANQMTAPPQMGQEQMPPQQQQPMMQQQVPAQPEPPAQESAEAKAFKALIEEASRFNMQTDGIFNYFNNQFFPNNPVDFKQPGLVDPETLKNINSTLDNILAPYRAAATPA